MANPQDELAELRAAVAALTARIHRLEQRAGLNAQAQPEGPATPSGIKPPTRTPTTMPDAPPPAPRLVQPFAEPPKLRVPKFATAATRDGDGLESRIGKLWLNRIGIFAILIGFSYSSTYAFDNGWLGPTGRIAVCIVAATGFVLWRERLRSKGCSVFSSS